MPTPVEVHCFLKLSALNDALDTARAWLNAPRPAAGDTGVYAVRWYAAWLRITLLDLAMFDDGVVLTHEGAADVLGTDVAMIQAALAQLRRDDDEEPKLTERDFARIAMSN
jgi:hypothetical protein